MKKRIISLFLSLVMCLTLLPTTVFAAKNYNFDVTVGGVTVSLTSDNCRDVFGDGKVNRKDYTVFTRYSSEMITPTVYELSVMDLKTDGKYSAKDLTVMKSHLTGASSLY